MTTEGVYTDWKGKGREKGPYWGFCVSTYFGNYHHNIRRFACLSYYHHHHHLTSCVYAYLCMCRGCKMGLWADRQTAASYWRRGRGIFDCIRQLMVTQITLCIDIRAKNERFYNTALPPEVAIFSL